MERDEARSILSDRASAVAQLIRSAPDAEQQVHASDWSVREVAAHVTLIGESFGRYLTGDTTPVIDLNDLATTNQVAIAQVEERDLGVLAERLESAVGRFLELTENRALDDPMTWHGVDTTVGAVYGIFLGELLMHGDDVARTLRRSWAIDRDAAIVVLEGTTEVSPFFLDAKAHRDAAFEVRLRGGPSYVFRFSGGGLRIEPGPASDVDCRVSADPVALLYVLYGRRSQWSEIARGRMMAFGRRPWLAFGFNDRFAGF